MLAKEMNLIELPNAPDIPGLRVRHYQGAEDHAIMVGLINAAFEADGVPEAVDVEDLAHYYADPKNLDPAKDILIIEANGLPVCYDRVFWMDEADGEQISARIYMSKAFMHPHWRRKGLGSAVMNWNEARLRQIATSHPAELPKLFEVIVPDTQAGAAILLKQFGYVATRHFFLMSRSLDAHLPKLALPPGLEIRPVEPEHMRAIWDAMEEAFLDHWGFMPRNDDDYQKWLKRPNTDVRLWKVAWDGDQVAGLSLNHIYQGERERLGFLQSWTEPICVRKAWRQRGLARVLLVESQREMKKRGVQVTTLEVDAQNPNQALHLYESCGYQIKVRRDLYRKELK